MKGEKTRWENQKKERGTDTRKDTPLPSTINASNNYCAAI